MNDKIKTDWMINGLLAVILVLLTANFISNHHANSASAAGGGWETDGIMVTSASVQERLIVVDTTKQNIMVYRPQGGGAFGLSGARSYKYDVQLDNIEKIPNNGWTYWETKRAYDAQHP